MISHIKHVDWRRNVAQSVWQSNEKEHKKVL